MTDSLITVGTNSYLSLADAKTYFAVRLGVDAWDAATDTTREKALIEACRHIDALPPQGWEGSPTNSTQALAWPRVNVVNKRASGASTSVTIGSITYYAADSYPAPLTEAQCEEALLILQRSASNVARYADEDRAAGITARTSSEGASVKYAEGSSAKYAGALVSEIAWQKVRELRRTTPSSVKV